MALIKNAAQMACPNCHAANPEGSPYCTRCGAPLVKTDHPVAGSESRFSTPHLKLDEPHFQDSFLTEGQDPILAKSTFERAMAIVISGETIEYIATANRSVGHLPDCVVATSKRIMVYK